MHKKNLSGLYTTLDSEFGGENPSPSGGILLYMERMIESERFCSHNSGPTCYKQPDVHFEKNNIRNNHFKTSNI